MSAIVDFFRLEAKDNKGRSLHDMLEMSDYQLEKSHDIIQWLFPLPEKSQCNQKAPVLDRLDIHEFRTDEILKERLLSCLDVILDFLGFVRQNEVVFDLRDEKKWLNRGNHNLLRISRILRSLTVLGLRPQAIGFLNCLLKVDSIVELAGSNTIKFWEEAIIFERRKVLILRGLPGSGKTTFAELVKEKCLPYETVVVSQDDYIVNSFGSIEYNPESEYGSKGGCFRRFLKAAEIADNIIVDGTNIENWMISPYIFAAEALGYGVEIHTFKIDPKTSRDRNTHNVPAGVIDNMAARFETVEVLKACPHIVHV